jgi:hypothetical protein
MSEISMRRASNNVTVAPQPQQTQLVQGQPVGVPVVAAVAMAQPVQQPAMVMMQPAVQATVVQQTTTMYAPPPQPRAIGLDTTGDGVADSVGMDTTGDGRVDTVVARQMPVAYGR